MERPYTGKVAHMRYATRGVIGIVHHGIPFLEVPATQRIHGIMSYCGTTSDQEEKIPNLASLGRDLRTLTRHSEARHGGIWSELQRIEKLVLTQQWRKRWSLRGIQEHLCTWFLNEFRKPNEDPMYYTIRLHS